MGWLFSLFRNLLAIPNSYFCIFNFVSNWWFHRLRRRLWTGSWGEPKPKVTQTMWMIMTSENGNSSKPWYLLLKENANANGNRWSFLLKRKYKQRAWQDNYDWHEDEKLYLSFLSQMFIYPFLRIFRFSLDPNIVFQNTISNCHWHISYLSCHKKIWWNIQLAGNLWRTLIPVCRFQLLSQTEENISKIVCNFF